MREKRPLRPFSSTCGARRIENRATELVDWPLYENLAAGNTDQPPANAEMYRGFLPLVEGMNPAPYLSPESGTGSTG